MVIRSALLIVLLLLPGAGSLAARDGQENQCLGCHEIHYQTRGRCIDCHGGIPTTQRKNIAHHGVIAGRYAAYTLPGHSVTEQGTRLLDKYACRRCHVSGGKGNDLAANLDLARQDSRPEELDEAIADPVLFMPRFHFHEKQRVALVNAILEGASRVGIPPGEIPRVIHFEKSEEKQERLFEKHCGSCHRSLTVRYGGLGSGLVGPNLSGLFSEFYPHNSGRRKDQRWTADSLRKWIKNPREFRPVTQMIPLRLTGDEEAGLLRELEGEGPGESPPPAP